MLNDKGEQILDDDDEIMGQGTDEGSIYDETLNADSVDDGSDIVDEDTPSPEDNQTDKRTNHLEERLQHMAAERAAEKAKTAELNKRLYDLEKSGAMTEVNSTAVALETRIKQAQQKKETLLEDGQFNEVNQVDEELYNLRTQKQNNDYRRSQVEQAEYKPEPEPEPETVPLPEPQVKWMEQNKWFNKMAGKTAYANDLYDELVLEGFDPNDQKTYEELDKRIGGAAKQSSQQRGERAPAPGDSVPGDAPAGSARENALTNSDLVKMRKWGIDTTDKDARAEWLRNKRRANQEFA